MTVMEAAHIINITSEPLHSIMADPPAISLLCQAVATGNKGTAAIMLIPLFAGSHRADMLKLAAALNDTTLEEMENRSVASVIASLPLEILSDLLETYAGIVEDINDLRKKGKCTL